MRCLKGFAVCRTPPRPPRTRQEKRQATFQAFVDKLVDTPSYDEQILQAAALWDTATFNAMFKERV